MFAGAKLGRPLSNMALAMLLRRMGYGHITAHGFRSSFRDWAAERTSFPREVAEMALAHKIRMPSRLLIGAAICSRRGAGSWSHGQSTARRCR